MQAICPQCEQLLPLLTEQENGQYQCQCGTILPYQHGILQFVEQDSFYEGKFTGTHQQSSGFGKFIFSILRFISIEGNEERMWRKSVRFIKQHSKGQDLKILNIGSGGGHGFLNELGSVTAVDLSLESLLSAQTMYDYCYQADARKIPFSDQTFDLVFSAHLLGHVPLKDKQRVIQEIFRVTKPGGFSLHSAECEADNFIYKKAKKYPLLYKKYFQDMYGHYGLELPSLCKKRFTDEMFEPIYEISDYCKGIIRPSYSYKVFFGAKEFREKDWLFNLLAILSELFSFNKYIRVISSILLYPLILFNRLAGADAVDSVKLLYRKKGEYVDKQVQKL